MKDKLPYRKTPCSNCPFRKDSLRGWLGKSRMTEICEADSFVCHKNTTLQCAGHMILLKNDNVFIRIAKALKITLHLKGKEKVFNTVEECIEHHKN